MIKRKKRLRRKLLAGSIASLGLLPGATLNAAEATNAPTKLDKIVVAGSSIPTAESEAAQPVQIYSQEKIQQLAPRAISDLLRTLPQASFGGLSGNNEGTGFASGARSVSLRGLGANNTLVLLNGRRVAPFAYANGNTEVFVDLNALPLAAVERVEVLTDGASAIYGADAVAGVINIVLKRNYQGTELNFSYENTTDTDVGKVSGSLTVGAANESTSLLFAFDYAQENALFNRDRVFSADTDYGLFSPNGYNAGSSRGWPGYMDVPRNAPGLVGTPYYNAAGGNIRLAPPSNTTGFATPAQYAPVDPFYNYNPYNYLALSQLTPETKALGAFAYLTQKVFEDKLEVFGEFSYRNTRARVEQAPSPIDFEGQGPGRNLPVGSVTNVNGVRVVGNRVTIPINNPYNPFGVVLPAAGRSVRIRLTEGGNRIQNIETDTYRLLGGLKGNFQIGTTSHDWEGAFLYNRSETSRNNSGNVTLAGLQAALNETSLATAFNPFAGPDFTHAAGIVPGIVASTSESGSTELMSQDAKIYGDIFDIPGGTLRYAAGGEHRSELYVQTKDQLQRDGGIAGQTPGVDSDASRSVTSAFAELKIPLLGNNFSLPGFNSVEVGAAVRAENYSDFGDTVKPRVTVAWRPFDDTKAYGGWLLRMSWGESFRPPSLPELFNSFYALRSGGSDPLRPGSAAFREIFNTIAGNPNLTPEESSSWNFGVVYTPKFEFIPGKLTIHADYFQLQRLGEVGSYGGVFGQSYMADPANINPVTSRPFYVRAPYDGRPGALTDPETGLPAGAVIAFDDSYSNFGSTIVDTIDFGLAWRFDTKTAGTFTLEANGTYLDSYRIQDLPGSGYFEQASQTGSEDAFPRLRGNISLFWNYQDITLGTVANIVGPVYWNDDNGEDQTVREYVTYDVQATYRLPWKVTLTGGIKNLLNTPPPLYYGFGSANGAYLADLHSPLLRSFYVQLNKKF